MKQKIFLEELEKEKIVEVKDDNTMKYIDIEIEEDEKGKNKNNHPLWKRILFFLMMLMLVSEILSMI